MPVETIRYRRNPFQRRVKLALETEKPIVAVFAGWRSGKTDYLGIEHAIRRQTYGNPDVRHLIAANTYSQLLDSTLYPLFGWLDRLAIPHVPDVLPKVGHPFSILIWNGAKWVEFLCRSMDSFDTIAGVTLGSVWLDEVWDTEKWTYDLAKSRLSDARSRHRQLVLSTTKDEPSHWMYSDIVKLLETNEPLPSGKRPSDVIEIVEGCTLDNAGNLVDGYVDEQRATLDERTYRRFILNEWVSTLSGLAYPYYSVTAHRKSLPLDASLPLCVSADFNISPCIWELFQDSPEHTHFFDEICQRQTDIWKMSAELQRRLIVVAGGDELAARQRHTIFYGDFTSSARRDVSATADSWGIIRAEFEGWNVEFRLAPNPRIIDRTNAVNSRMRSVSGISRFTHDPACVELGKDFETVTVDDLRDGKGKAGDRTHASDAAGYPIFYEHRVNRAIGRQYTN